MTGKSVPAITFRRRSKEGLEHSRVLVLCMSAQAFGSNWAQLESYTLEKKNKGFNELREMLQLRLLGEVSRFSDEELKAVVSLLAAPAWCGS